MAVYVSPFINTPIIADQLSTTLCMYITAYTRKTSVSGVYAVVYKQTFICVRGKSQNVTHTLTDAKYKVL